MLTLEGKMNVIFDLLGFGLAHCLPIACILLFFWSKICLFVGKFITGMQRKFAIH